MRTKKGTGTISAEGMILKARLYRAFALVFVLAGLAVFTALFLEHVGGAFFSAMTDPFVVMIVIFPFLPAVALSFLAGRIEKKILKNPQDADTDAPGP